MSTPARYQLTLTAEAGWPNHADRRLAMALKCLLRSFGLRCTEARQLDAPESTPAAPDGAMGQPGAGKAATSGRER